MDIQFRRNVDDIHGILFSLTAPDDETLREVADLYDDACQAANERLTRCGQLLDRGLRTEALQQCEIEPNLLDVVATLDFPELPQWRDLLGQFGIAGPTILMTDVAAELNEAYAVEQPMQALLKAHRILAIARAKLPARIQILRKIAAFDSGNELWQTDLKEYEKVRLQELDGEIAAARKSRDLEALAGFAEELNNGWSIRGTEGLLSTVESARREITAHKARHAMDVLATRLNDAYTGFDVDRGRELRRQWQRCLSVAELPPDDPRHELVAPGLEWLDQQDQQQTERKKFDQAAAHFAEALESEKSLTRLESAYRAIPRDVDEIPEELEQRYAERLEADRRRRQRGRMTMIAVSLLLVAGLIAAGVILTRNQQFRQEVATAAGTLRRQVEQLEFDQARRHIEQVESERPPVAKAESFREAVHDFERAFAKDRDRRARRDAAITAVAAEGGLGNPDWDAFQTAVSLSVTQQEKDELVALGEEIEQEKDRLQQEADESWLTRTDRLKEMLPPIDDVRNGAITVTEDEILRWQTEVQKLADNRDRISPEHHAPYIALSEAVAAIQEEYERRNQEAGLRTRITLAVGDPGKFSAALQDYIDAFPGTPASQSFAEVMQQQSLWEGIEAWNVVSRQWYQTNLDSITAADATRLADQILETAEKHRLDGRRKGFLDRVSHLEAIYRRGDERPSPLLNNLRDLMSNKVVINYWMVRTSDGNSYYCSNKPAAASGNQTISYIVGLDQKLATATVNLTDAKIGPAPHSVVAADALARLYQLETSNWEQVFQTLIRKIYEQEDMDPVIRASMLHRTLEAACRGSHGMEAAYGEHLKILTTSRLNWTVSWMDPEDRQAEQQRTVAKIVLQQLDNPRSSQGSLEDAAKKSAELLGAFRSKSEVYYDWVGWLCRSRDGSWECKTARPPSVGGILGTFQLDGGKVVPHSVGRSDGERVQISATRASDFVEGCPVYLGIPIGDRVTE